MPARHSRSFAPHARPPGFGRTLLADLQHPGLSGSIWRDLQDLYAFYLSEDERDRLRRMGRLRRWFNTFRWVLASLGRNLAPPRRLILLAAVVAVGLGLYRDRVPEVVVGFALVVAVLMFELRDKLLARDELEIGRAVQLALLPDRHPVLAGWDIWLYTRPANDVGGDLIDHLAHDDGRLDVALGDVAGKGLGAALLMAKLQSTLRAWAIDAASLSDLGARANVILCRDGLANRFATLVYLRLVPSVGIVGLLNAGHCRPLVIRAGGIAALPPVALPLGIDPAAVYEEQRVDLAPGDMLLVYSDGLSEAIDEAGQMFGDDRVRDLAAHLDGMTAPAAGQRVLTALADFAGRARPMDDLSLAVLRRTS